ncbi:MAG: hypothetical protein QM756_23830 [Polyangiaceae bacterium]
MQRQGRPQPRPASPHSPRSPEHAATAATSAAAKAPKPSRRPKLPPFFAAVRFGDGHRNFYEISNARDVAEARRMILAELEGVVSAMIVVQD